MHSIFLFVLLALMGINCDPITRTINIEDVYIEWTNNGSYTEFYVTSSLDDDIDVKDAWLGVGLNRDRTMGGANAVVCENTAEGSDVSHYYNDRTMPILMSSSNRQYGLTSTSIKSENGNLTCRFTRNNQDADQRYNNINDDTRLYMIVAFGSGKLSFHGENYGKSSTLLGFSVEPATTTTSTTTTTKTQTSSPVTTAQKNTTTTVTTEPFDPLDYLNEFYDSFLEQLKSIWNWFSSWF